MDSGGTSNLKRQVLVTSVYKLNRFKNHLCCYVNNDTRVRSRSAAEMSSSFSEDDKTEETSSFED